MYNINNIERKYCIKNLCATNIWRNETWFYCFLILKRNYIQRRRLNYENNYVKARSCAYMWPTVDTYHNIGYARFSPRFVPFLILASTLCALIRFSLKVFSHRITWFIAALQPDGTKRIFSPSLSRYHSFCIYSARVCMCKTEMMGQESGKVIVYE